MMVTFPHEELDDHFRQSIAIDHRQLDLNHLEYPPSIHLYPTSSPNSNYSISTATLFALGIFIQLACAEMT